ncbi:phytoene desaturase family protein [Aquirhabdus parva]|uniref:NAD(P)/FAD-dependent oxidoreductase n=1 Tax=Aquirhabdus parva TaxID=2283318 RepID=A0A345P9Y0_9GAMM|nr:NAD(P)/FAD-dependent oxidoreductase [Aquirhabdus parva]AXI04089.1 NAD(P)/FAD-dependent oxidoreductase [Aquirhabdus parva]
MKRTGKRYRTGRAAEHYDVIVVGSGMSGLTTAALLSKVGQKVCVLEQHYTAGGLTHSYENNGYEWDVGVHYIGEVHKPHSPIRKLFDVISDQQLKWAPMDDVYDRVIIGGTSYDLVRGRDNFKANLKKHFPDDAQAIDAYVALVDKVAKASPLVFMDKAIPKLLSHVYTRFKSRILPREAMMQTQTVLEELTSNPELIGVLAAQWGDYGTPPQESPFFMHAMLVKHFFGGGNFPVGGAWKIADTIIPVIRASGGEVFTYARVAEILIENKRAVGVRLDNGDVLRADKVVSACDVRLTFEKLLSPNIQQQYGFAKKLKQVAPSKGYLNLFAGFKGTAEELNLPKTNLWVYPSADHGGNIARHEADSDNEFPVLYISFPSAKDPEWDQHYLGKSTVEVVVPSSMSFDQWTGTTWNQRGEDYEAVKAQLSERILDALYHHVPQLRGKLDYSELSTPLSTIWFQNNTYGEIYGLDHTVDRFKQDWLRPQTPIKGLYLTGQDILTAGVTGALMSGLLTTVVMQGLGAHKVLKLLK